MGNGRGSQEASSFPRSVCAKITVQVHLDQPPISPRRVSTTTKFQVQIDQYPQRPNFKSTSSSLYHAETLSPPRPVSATTKLQVQLDQSPQRPVSNITSTSFRNNQALCPPRLHAQQPNFKSTTTPVSTTTKLKVYLNQAPQRPPSNITWATFRNHQTSNADRSVSTTTKLQFHLRTVSITTKL